MTINRHDMHVCLVSTQPTPNFIPVLDKRFRPKSVLLVVSREQAQQADWLEHALAPYVKVTRLDIADAWDAKGLWDTMSVAFSQFKDDSVALNVTGGTKPMAIAAQDVFRELGKPVFYVHPQSNKVVPMLSSEEPFELQERIRIPEYLAIHGYQELSRAVVPADDVHLEICAELVLQAVRFARPIRILNALAAEARKGLRVPLKRDAGNERLRELINRFSPHGLLSVENDFLKFRDEAARLFVNGGWLEELAAHSVDDLKREHGIQDWAPNLKVESPGGSRNELDVALLVANRLHLIECKTANMAEKGEDAGKALYKLDSLSGMGGLTTKGMIVSYHELPPLERQRAQDLGIRLVHGGKLRNLGQHIASWIDESRGGSLEKKRACRDVR